jgi:hypothetical protein
LRRRSNLSGGKTEVLVSGAPTTNTYQYLKTNVLGYGETSVFVQNTGTGGSGVGVIILGYPSYESPLVLGSTYVILTSGDVISSGRINMYSTTDAYEALGVGYASAGTNFSGNVTIVVTRKRRQ